MMSRMVEINNGYEDELVPYVDICGRFASNGIALLAGAWKTQLQVFFLSYAAYIKFLKTN